MHQPHHRSIAVMCAVALLVLAVPGRLHAGPVNMREIGQVIVGGATRQSPELRLNSISQEGNTVVGGSSAAPAPAGNGGNSGSTTSVTASTSATDGTSASTVTVAITTQEGSGGQIETIEFGDVTGTVCDCGEIVAPGGGGFPKWPLLALAVIPLLFIGGGGGGGGSDSPSLPPTPPTVTPTPPTPPVPTPTPVVPPPPPIPPPPPTPIPEPATLMLFGSGVLALGAKLRRRRRMQQEAETVATTAYEGEEV